MSLAERYGRAKAAFIRVNYGLQRHAGGGMAVRTIACLPAVTGHWRRAGGGVQLSSSANFQFDKRALERPDLSPPVRTINMIRLGDALTRTRRRRRRPAGARARRVQLEPGRGGAGSQRSAARAGARGSVHRGARAFPDRHRRLRGHRAARDDAARALGSASVVRPPLRLAQPARRSSRWANRCRTARSFAGWARGWAWTIPRCATTTSR